MIAKAEAEKAGITLDVLEKLFIQAIVDAYHARMGSPATWPEDLLFGKSAVQEKGVPRYLGSPDDLKFLLMKAVNRKNPVTGRYAISPYRGLSFLGVSLCESWVCWIDYAAEKIDIYYDRRDISVIYLFSKGNWW